MVSATAEQTVVVPLVNVTVPVGAGPAVSGDASDTVAGVGHRLADDRGRRRGGDARLARSRPDDDGRLAARADRAGVPRVRGGDRLAR